MPIGKNALKRVTNNGYSKVVSEAPDMENSTHATYDDVKIKEEKKTAPSKKEVKTQPKQSVAKKTPKTKKTVVESASSHPDGFVRFEIGAELPAHLL